MSETSERRCHYCDGVFEPDANMLNVGGSMGQSWAHFPACPAPLSVETPPTRPCFKCGKPVRIGSLGMLMHPTENRPHDCAENWMAEHGYAAPLASVAAGEPPANPTANRLANDEPRATDRLSSRGGVSAEHGASPPAVPAPPDGAPTGEQLTTLIRGILDCDLEFGSLELEEPDRPLLRWLESNLPALLALRAERDEASIALAALDKDYGVLLAEATTWEQTARSNEDQITALRHNLAEMQTENLQMLLELAAVFPGSKWADKLGLPPSPHASGPGEAR